MVKRIKYYWTNRPLQDEANRSTSIYEIRYSDALKKDQTKKIVEEFKMIAINPMNLIISIEGPQGSGKSWQVQFLAEKLEELGNLRYDIDNVRFSVTDMNKRVQEVKRRSILILDEQVLAYGLGTGTERSTLLNIERTIRKNKLCLFFLAPDFIRHIFHYHLEVWEMGSNRPWDFSIPLSNQWKYTKSIIFDRKLHPFGYIITSKPTKIKFLTEYEKRKNEFITRLLEERIENREKYVYDKALELLKDKSFMRKFTTLRKINSKRNLVGITVGIGFNKEEKKTITDIIIDNLEKEEE